MRDVSQRRVVHRRTALGPVAEPVHVREPPREQELDVPARVRLALARGKAVRAREHVAPAAVLLARRVERGQHLRGRGRGDVRDVHERVRERRRRHLVVLRERPAEDVVPLRARVDDDRVRDGGATVVHDERVLDCLAEERE